MKRLYYIMLTSSTLLISTLLIVFSNASQLLSSEKESKTIMVYLKPSADNPDELMQFLNGDHRILNYTLETKEDVLKNFKTSFPEYSQGLNFSDELLSAIPQIIEVNFRSMQDADGLSKQLRSYAAVDQIQSNFGWLDKLNSFKIITLNFIILMFSFFAFVLIVITVLIAHRFVSNEKDKLQIYSFCGATEKQIFRTLFSKIYLLSAFGFGSGILLSYGFYFLLHEKIGVLDSEKWFVNRIHYLNVSEVAALSMLFAVTIYTTITFSAKSALKEVWNED